MVEALYEYLKQVMAQSNWLDGNIPKQARAIFSTICILGHIQADTAVYDRMIFDLYESPGMKDAGISCDEFDLFMCEYIV